ncbi:MAG: rhodanese-like domain-containing protein [Bacteroidota bacterium]
MIKALGLDKFLSLAQSLCIIDVRSPGEFAQGHIPNAINLPLLNNDERAIIGTTYKQLGKEMAVIKGFELVGHKFSDYIIKAKELAPNKKILIHCWRGGLRSNIMAWVLQTAGFKVQVLAGGYKTYRQWALNIFDQPRNVMILSGNTGTGKTDVLLTLLKNG